MQYPTIQEIINYLTTIAPEHYQEPYDNAGLIIGNPNTQVKNILTTLDVTEQVIQEAVEKKCTLIISHHPPIFQPIKKIGQDHVSRTITQAIQHQIAIYTLHTNLDFVQGGVNTALAEILNLSQTSFLKELPIPPTKTLNPPPPRGAGIIGTLPQPLSIQQFLHYTKQKLNLTSLRYATTSKKIIHKIAVAGGVGISLLPQAINNSVDAFITADIKYHQFFDSDKSLLLLDIGHYESEIHIKRLLVRYLSEKFNKIDPRESTTITNPIKYYV